MDGLAGGDAMPQHLGKEDNARTLGRRPPAIRPEQLTPEQTSPSASSSSDSDSEEITDRASPWVSERQRCSPRVESRNSRLSAGVMSPAPQTVDSEGKIVSDAAITAGPSASLAIGKLRSNFSDLAVSAGSSPNESYDSDTEYPLAAREPVARSPLLPMEPLHSSSPRVIDCSDSLSSGTDGSEYRKFLRRQKDMKRRKRMTSGSIAKRTITESIGSDSDHEDLIKPFLYVEEAESSARRLRRRIGNRHSLMFQDHPWRLEELDDEESMEDRVDDDLARELPYYEYDLNDFDSDDPPFPRSSPRRAHSRKIPLVTLEGQRELRVPSGGEIATRTEDIPVNETREDSDRGTSDPDSDDLERILHITVTRSRKITGVALKGRRELREASEGELAPRIGENVVNNKMREGSDHETSDSDKSDLESIMSEAPSLASSRSSALMSIDLDAIDELRTLLLTTESLKPLYEVAFSKVGPERFHRNVRRLLLRYGRDLAAEATTTAQVRAARFVRFAASRVSMQIKENIMNKKDGERHQERQSKKALGTYLKQIQAVEEASNEDDSDNDPEETSLHTLDNVKNSMISSAAFSNLRRSLRIWLNMEDLDEQLAAQSRPVSDAKSQDAHSASADAVPEVTTKNDPLYHGVGTRSAATDEVDLEETPLITERPLPMGSANRTASGWFCFVKIMSKFCRNRLSGLLLAKVPPGQIRISWICRCGDMLRIQVSESQGTTAIAFAKQAAGPNASTVVTQSSNGIGATSSSSENSAASETTSQGSSPPSLTPSTSNVSAGTDTTASSSSTSATSLSAGSRPDSPNTIPSGEERIQPEPFLPAGTKKYMLLCVNTSGPRGIPQRKLANVDVTDVECGTKMFQRLRNAYYALRRSRNPLLIPKTMQYVKLQLLFLQKSGECIGSYQVDSIPSHNEVLKQEYAFSPCPPQIGPLPLPPDIFMHGFLDPGDHLGPMAVDILPKKLWCQLRWDARAHDRYNAPTGWGFYIIEGINWALVSWCAAVALLGVTVLTVAWSVLAEDVQGGTGLGQYCLAVLTLSVSVWLLKDSVRDGM